jgi:hypothetical protein
MYMQKYISLFSVVQSKPTHTLATRDQATGFSSNRNYENQTEHFEMRKNYYNYIYKMYISILKLPKRSMC